MVVLDCVNFRVSVCLMFLFVFVIRVVLLFNWKFKVIILFFLILNYDFCLGLLI